jgi:hypothetical protein
MPQRFEGDLNWIDPALLVNKDKANRLESFFLGLGVVFNDLKGLLLFEKMLADCYEAPADDEVSSHVGNFGGVRVQLQKLHASTVNEFFIFLKKNSDVMATNEFKEIFSELARVDKQVWHGMVAAAHNNLAAVTDMMKAVVYVRSNVAFHYDHSGKVLRNAFVSRFLSDSGETRSDKAYYSIGDAISNTRFYFADAAVEESLYIAAGKKFGKSSAGDLALQKYHQQLSQTVSTISSSVAALLRIYIRLCRNRVR